VARFADLLTDDEKVVMAALRAELRRTKPSGWSIVGGDREIVLRPKDRRIGKFGITVVVTNGTPQFSIGFFSRRRNHWLSHEHFAFAPASAPEMLGWAEATVAAEAESRS
jgi:hypothetical protein